MYLRHKDSLTIRMIAAEWAKERASGDDRLDVVSELLQAFWIGDLAGVRPAEDLPELDRSRALMQLANSRGDDGHPGIRICHTEDDQDAMVTYHDDGLVEVDARTGIILPVDQKQWTARIHEEAYRDLSNLRIEDYATVFRELFNGLTLAKLDFLDFIRRRGLEPPRFWFHPDDPLLGISAAARKKNPKRAPIPEQPGRGRKISFDYGDIEDFLDLLRRKEGHEAFKDQTALHERVCSEFGASKVPKRSQFRKYLKRYCSERFSV